MGIRLAGGGEVREVLEQLNYSPGTKDTGDLEATTKTITATAEATGLGNADYSAALTLPAPADARLVVKRIAARLGVTIDSMTAATLYCRVYVDAQAADNRLFDLSWSATGAKLATANTYSGSLATIFNLLKNGGAHTFYFYFWVNTGNAVLSECRLYEGVGSDGADSWGGDCLQLLHRGFASIRVVYDRAGTGNLSGWMKNTGDEYNASYAAPSTSILQFILENSLVHDPTFAVTSAVATDLVSLTRSNFIIRKEE